MDTASSSKQRRELGLTAAANLAIAADSDILGGRYEATQLVIAARAPVARRGGTMRMRTEV